MSLRTIFSEILLELDRAKSVHPDNGPEWKGANMFEMCGYVACESGEAHQAAQEYMYRGGSIEAVKIELIQTASTAIRVLEKLGKD